MVISRLEQESGQAREECERAAENRIKYALIIIMIIIINHIYTGKLAQQNGFAAINQGPANLVYPKIYILQQYNKLFYNNTIRRKIVKNQRQNP